jgi:Putative serine dehydratase domain
MDADYGRVREPDGAELPYQHALFVLATVVSANRAGQVTVDAGTKALAVNGPAPDLFIGVPAGSSYVFAGDEHGTIKLPPGAAAPAVGRRVLIGATHCDPTVNLHSGYRVVIAGGSLARWPIASGATADPKLVGRVSHKSATPICGVTRRVAADYAARYWLLPIPLRLSALRTPVTPSVFPARR